MKKYLVNAFSLQMLQKGGLVRFDEIAPEDIPADVVSAIGHANTAVVLSDLLGFPVPMNRINVSTCWQICHSGENILGGVCMKMKIFTIENGKVTEGVRVDSFTLKGADVSIPTIIIGEEGRGRKLGVLSVQLFPDTYAEWKEKGYTYIHSATVGTTKSGKPKLSQTEEADTTEKCICVFRTKIGFRGGNSHTGDRKGEYWVREWYASFPESVPMKERYTWEEVQRYSREYLKARYPGEDISQYSPNAGFRRVLDFYPFPGEILCEGIIAQGDAGRMGSGEQLVAIMPENIIFRTGYSGRLYGAPSAHYYLFRDGQILSATWDEREVSDIF